MKLSEQVISLDIAKRLKQLGFFKESKWLIRDRATMIMVCKREDDLSSDEYPAYTVSELMEYMKREDNMYRIEFNWNHAFKTFIIRLYEDKELIDGVEESTMANAFGQMLVQLLESRRVLSFIL